MDTLSWATKSPPCPVEELPSPLVQRRRSNELCFRKSFRHVNNVSHPGSFLIHFPPESLFTSPESLFRIYRNPPFTSPGIRTPPRQRLMSGGTSPSRRGCAPGSC